MLCYGVMLSVNVTVISMSATASERIKTLGVFL